MWGCWVWCGGVGVVWGCWCGVGVLVWCEGVGVGWGVGVVWGVLGVSLATDVYALQTHLSNDPPPCPTLHARPACHI